MKVFPYFLLLAIAFSCVSPGNDSSAKKSRFPDDTLICTLHIIEKPELPADLRIFLERHYEDKACLRLKNGKVTGVSGSFPDDNRIITYLDNLPELRYLSISLSSPYGAEFILEHPGIRKLERASIDFGKGDRITSSITFSDTIRFANPSLRTLALSGNFHGAVFDLTASSIDTILIQSFDSIPLGPFIPESALGFRKRNWG